MCPMLDYFSPHNSPVELMTSGEEMTRVADSVSSGAQIIAAPISSRF